MKRTTAPALALAVLACAAAVPAQQPQPDPRNPVILRVNGAPVYAADVSMMMQTVAPQMQQSGAEADQSAVIRMATQRVIEQKLLAQAAREADMTADEARVKSAMAEIVGSAGGREQLVANLEGAGTTLGHLESNLREMALAQAYVDAKIKPTVTVTDEDAREYYIGNPQDFRVPEQVHARHILIEVPEDADPAADEAALAEAEIVRERVTTGGEDFATVAREHSDCPSASEGGDLGKFAADQMVEPFSEAAFALEPGQISDVVRTKFGYHVIKVEERREARMTPFEEVREMLTGALQMRSTSEAIGAEIARLRDQATIENLVDLPEKASMPAPAPGGDQ